MNLLIYGALVYQHQSSPLHFLLMLSCFQSECSARVFWEWGDGWEGNWGLLLFTPPAWLTDAWNTSDHTDEMLFIRQSGGEMLILPCYLPDIINQRCVCVCAFMGYFIMTETSRLFMKVSAQVVFKYLSCVSKTVFCSHSWKEHTVSFMENIKFLSVLVWVQGDVSYYLSSLMSRNNDCLLLRNRLIIVVLMLDHSAGGH